MVFSMVYNKKHKFHPNLSDDFHGPNAWSWICEFLMPSIWTDQKCLPMYCRPESRNRCYVWPVLVASKFSNARIWQWLNYLKYLKMTNFSWVHCCCFCARENRFWVHHIWCCSNHDEYFIDKYYQTLMGSYLD